MSAKAEYSSSFSSSILILFLYRVETLLEGVLEGVLETLLEGMLETVYASFWYLSYATTVRSVPNPKLSELSMLISFMNANHL